MAPSTDSGGSSRPGLPGAGGGSREDSEFLSPPPPAWVGHLPRAAQAAGALSAGQARPVVSQCWAGLPGTGSPTDVRGAEGPHVPPAPGSSGA